MPGDKERRRSELLAGANQDANIAEKVQKALARVEKFGENWISVDREALFEKFAPHAIPTMDGVKIRYHEPGRTIDIVYDPIGDYFRLENTIAKSKADKFLMPDGTPPPLLVRKTNGRFRGLTRDERMKLTHFKLK